MMSPVCATVLSPDGYLYEKQAILEYILHQKTEIAKKMKVSRIVSGSDISWLGFTWPEEQQTETKKVSPSHI